MADFVSQLERIFKLCRWSIWKTCSWTSQSLQWFDFHVFLFDSTTFFWQKHHFIQRYLCRKKSQLVPWFLPEYTVWQKQMGSVFKSKKFNSNLKRRFIRLLIQRHHFINDISINIFDGISRYHLIHQKKKNPKQRSKTRCFPVIDLLNNKYYR